MTPTGQINLGESEHDFRVPDGEYRRIERSSLIAIGADELSEQLDWPTIEAERAARARR